MNYLVSIITVPDKCPTNRANAAVNTFYLIGKYVFLARDLTKANVEAVRVAGLVTTLVSVTGGGGMPEMPTGVVNSRLQGTNGAIPRVSFGFKNSQTHKIKLSQLLLTL